MRNFSCAGCSRAMVHKNIHQENRHDDEANFFCLSPVNITGNGRKKETINTVKNAIIVKDKVDKHFPWLIYFNLEPAARGSA